MTFTPNSTGAPLNLYERLAAELEGQPVGKGRREAGWDVPIDVKREREDL